jgi:hypothetical protein
LAGHRPSPPTASGIPAEDAHHRGPRGAPGKGPGDAKGGEAKGDDAKREEFKKRLESMTPEQREEFKKRREAREGKAAQ